MSGGRSLSETSQMAVLSDHGGPKHPLLPTQPLTHLTYHRPGSVPPSNPTQ